MPEKNNEPIRHFVQQMEEEDTIDLLELFFALLNHWRVILLSTVLVAAIALAYCKLLVTPVYQSTSELYVLTKSTSITSLADLQIGSNLSNDYLEVIGGRPVVDQVIRDLGLDMTYREMGSKLSISNLSDRIITITARDTDPAMAKAIADRMAEVASAYIAEKMDQDPPSIIQSGYADGDPVSPRTKRTTLIGAMLGFLLAAGIVIMQSILNDSIMTADDVENKLGIHVLGTLPLESDLVAGKKKTGRKKKRKH